MIDKKIPLITIDSDIEYPKDSFDRFGDDLCELLLSQMSIGDRFRYEAVSKQWQRLIYTSESYILLNKYCSDGWLLFESMVKKLPYMRHVFLRYGISHETIDLLTIYCPYVRHIHCEKLYVSHLRLMLKLWPQLRSLTVDEMIYDSQLIAGLQEIMMLCRNLRQLTVNRLNTKLLMIMTDTPNDVLFTKLQKFSFVYSNQDMDSVQQFVDQYGPRLQSLEIAIQDNCTLKSVSALMIHTLPAMTSLSHLSLNINCINVKSELFGAFMLGLKTIGQRLNQLKSMSVVITRYHNMFAVNVADMLTAFNTDYHYLRRLSLVVKDVYDNSNSEVLPPIGLLSLNRMKHLIHLSIESPNLVIDGSFDDNFGTHSMTRLKYISLKCRSTKTMIRSLIDKNITINLDNTLTNYGYNNILKILKNEHRLKCVTANELDCFE